MGGMVFSTFTIHTLIFLNPYVAFIDEILKSYGRHFGPTSSTSVLTWQMFVITTRGTNPIAGPN